MKTRAPRAGRFGFEGFTIVELLVLVGIIAVLIGLALPAVQAARESARRAKCANNLKQLVLAANSFAAAQGGFPRAAFWGPSTKGNERTVGYFSVHCSLLPHLDQSTLFNSINFQLPSSSYTWLDQYQQTAATQMVGVFLCPSDPFTRASPFATNSYRACAGLPQADVLGNARYLVWDGVFDPVSGQAGSAIPLGAITDGLSNSIAFSEKPVGSGDGAAYSAFRDWIPADLPGNWTSDGWVDACARLRETALASAEFDGGGSWMIPGGVYTAFYASTPPNSSVPDCGTRAIFNGVGIFGARSYHPGGVNAAMADGSVRWFGSGTNARTWRSLGTRDGGEIAQAMP